MDVSSGDDIDHSPSQLLHRVLQIALDIYTNEVGEGALTQRQYIILKVLEGREGISQSELVKLSGIDRSTMADLVARMMAKGLLEREKSSLDARANLVRPSLLGRTALIEMKPKVALADEKILSLLTPPKRETFVKLLRKIAHHVKQDPISEDLVLQVKEEKKKKGAKKHTKADKAHKKMKNLPMPKLNNGAEDDENPPSNTNIKE